MIMFENEYFLSEKLDGNKRVVTVLKDDRCFYGINLKGCKFATNTFGFVEYEFTDKALKEIKLYCEANSANEEFFKAELRNRTLNVLISMI